MRIREDKNLAKLAKMVDVPYSELSEKIAEEFVKANILEDTAENYGNLLTECYVDAVLVVNIVNAFMAAANVDRCTSDMFTLLEKLYIVGDGNCPNCGEDMIIQEQGGNRIGGDGYVTEIEYSVEWERRVCVFCGLDKIFDIN